MAFDPDATPNHWVFRYRALAGGEKRADPGEDRLCRSLDGKPCAVVESRRVLDANGLAAVLVVFGETRTWVGVDELVAPTPEEIATREREFAELLQRRPLR